MLPLAGTGSACCISLPDAGGTLQVNMVAVRDDTGQHGSGSGRYEQWGGGGEGGGEGGGKGSGGEGGAGGGKDCDGGGRLGGGGSGGGEGGSGGIGGKGEQAAEGD